MLCAHDANGMALAMRFDTGLMTRVPACPYIVCPAGSGPPDVPTVDARRQGGVLAAGHPDVDPQEQTHLRA